MAEPKENIININVIIADRPYPLKIKPSEEENVRKAARAINEKVTQFQQAYAAKDKQDYLAMCTLMYAVDNINNQSKLDSENAGFEEELAELEAVISSY